jgi:UDP-glucose 4-epimerase
MRTFLVTGGAGFIGSHIANALVRRGDRVRVLDNLSTGFLSNLEPIREDVEFIEADLVDSQAVARAVAGVDCIFHEAALASVPLSVDRPLDTHASCATGTVALLDAARRAGVRRLVYASSSALYGDRPGTPKHETDLPAPISPYGAAKLAAEYYCGAFSASFPIQTVALRYFNVFGPQQDPKNPYAAVIPIFITAILSRKPPVIFGDGQQSRDFTYVADVVQANLLAADAEGAANRVMNVATGRSISLLELLAGLNEVLGTRVEAVFAPPRPGDIRESTADIALARKLLGYEPAVPLIDGLRRSIDYYRRVIGK